MVFEVFSPALYRFLKFYINQGKNTEKSIQNMCSELSNVNISEK